MPADLNIKGDPIELDVAALALITLGDLDNVRQTWNRYSPKPYRDLLDALSLSTMAAMGDATPKFWFDQHEQSYGMGREGFIDPAAIRRTFHEATAKARDDADALAVAMALGLIALADWQQTFAAQLKTDVLMYEALGRGGVGNVTADDLNAASEKVRTQYEFLNRFAKDAPSMTPESIGNRAGLYVLDSSMEYEAARGRGHKAAGFEQERSRLGNAEHCKGEGSCQEQADNGWVPMGELIPCGQRICLWNCHCWIEYRRVEELVAA